MKSVKLVISPDAETDIKESLNWYEKQKAGLGNQFINELDIIFDRILNNPLQFPEVISQIRKANIRRFPFSVFYTLIADDVFIIAIFHNSRNPKIWKTLRIPFG